MDTNEENNEADNEKTIDVLGYELVRDEDTRRLLGTTWTGGDEGVLITASRWNDGQDDPPPPDALCGIDLDIAIDDGDGVEEGATVRLFGYGATFAKAEVEACTRIAALMHTLAGLHPDRDDLRSALRIAAARGWLVLPDLGVDGFVRTHGEVLRYDTTVDPELVARKVHEAMANAEPRSSEVTR